MQPGTATPLRFFLALVTLAALLASRPAPAQGPNDPCPPVPQPARLDVAICLDATGSMADEIAVVKDRIRAIVSRIATVRPAPDVRFALIAYRDRGDEFITDVTDFTRDIDALHGKLCRVEATGGGDKREDVGRALDRLVNHLSWEASRQVGRLAFLIGDAGPHQDYGDTDAFALARAAGARRIPIQTIGCSGITPEEVHEFQRISRLSGGQYEPLTYRLIAQDQSGRRKVLIEEEGRRFAMGEEEDGESWRDGAGAMRARGALGEPMPPAAPAEGGAAAGDAAGLEEVARENNLDRLLGDRILEALRDR